MSNAAEPRPEPPARCAGRCRCGDAVARGAGGGGGSAPAAGRGREVPVHGRGERYARHDAALSGDRRCYQGRSRAAEPACSTTAPRSATGRLWRRPVRRPPAARSPRPPRRSPPSPPSGQSGTLPCLRLGSSSRFERRRSKPAISLRARLGRVDHVVDVAALGGDVRVGEPLGVLVDELGLARRSGRRPQ